MLRSRLQSRELSTDTQQLNWLPPETALWESRLSHWTPHAHHCCKKTTVTIIYRDKCNGKSSIHQWWAHLTSHLSLWTSLKTRPVCQDPTLLSTHTPDHRCPATGDSPSRQKTLNQVKTIKHLNIVSDAYNARGTWLQDDSKCMYYHQYNFYYSY